jgi:hypothetical protein
LLIGDRRLPQVHRPSIRQRQGQTDGIHALITVGSCPCTLRLIQQPDKPGTMPSVQHVYEGVLPWSRICSSTSSR